MLYVNSFSSKLILKLKILQGNIEISATSTLFPSNMPFEFEHSGTYTCIATNQYGSTSENINLNSNYFYQKNFKLIFFLNNLLVEKVSHEISIDIEPTNIFPIDSEISLNCKLPESSSIWWSSINHRRKEINPLKIRIGLDHINRRFICHAKGLNGKIYRKMIRIQRYSDEELTASIVNNEMERSLRHNQRKILQKTPKVHIKLITSPTDIQAGGIIQLHCYVEGIKQKQKDKLFILV